MDEHVNAILKAGDTISALAVITTLAGFLPPIAAVFAMLWYAVQICIWTKCLQIILYFKRVWQPITIYVRWRKTKIIFYFI